MGAPSKDPKTARWDKRTAKRFVDELTFRVMAPWALSGTQLKRVLSLPAADWTWERNFTTTFPNNWVTFAGIEKNQAVWRKMKAAAEKLSAFKKNHQYVPCPQAVNMAEFLRKTPETYDMIYLDWMGTWSVEKEQQVRSVFQRKLLRKHGLLRVTMALDRGKKAAWDMPCEQDSDIIAVQDLRGGGGPLPEWKVYGIPRLIMQIAEEYGTRAKMISSIAYMSREHPLKKGAPEASFLFRV